MKPLFVIWLLDRGAGLGFWLHYAWNYYRFAAEDSRSTVVSALSSRPIQTMQTSPPALENRSIATSKSTSSYIWSLFVSFWSETIRDIWQHPFRAASCRRYDSPNLETQWQLGPFLLLHSWALQIQISPTHVDASANIVWSHHHFAVANSVLLLFPPHKWDWRLNFW